MVDDKPEWKDLKNKCVRIKDIGKFYLPIEVDLLVPYLIVPFNVLILDVDDKKIKFRPEGKDYELHCSILKDGVLKEDDLFSVRKYKFLKELTKWEILNFEVADYIGGIYDESETDFDSKIRTKSKIECEYMQKSANFNLEKYFPIKRLAVFLFGLILYSKIDFKSFKPIFPLSSEVSSSLWMLSLILFIFIISLSYFRYRRRYQELILKLEARILS